MWLGRTDRTTVQGILLCLPFAVGTLLVLDKRLQLFQIAFSYNPHCTKSQVLTTKKPSQVAVWF